MKIQLDLSNEEINLTRYALQELHGRRCEQYLDATRADVKKAAMLEAIQIQAVIDRINDQTNKPKDTQNEREKTETAQAGSQKASQ